LELVAWDRAVGLGKVGGWEGVGDDPQQTESQGVDVTSRQAGKLSLQKWVHN